jgi:hypothetical protein
MWQGSFFFTLSQQQPVLKGLQSGRDQNEKKNIHFNDKPERREENGDITLGGEIASGAARTEMRGAGWVCLGKVHSQRI